MPQPAGTTYLLKTGDCDDLSYLYISLCRTADIPSRFIRGFLITIDEELSLIGYEPHAWVEVFVGNNIGVDGWIPVECAGVSNGNNKIKNEIYQNFGVERTGHLRVFTDDGTDESFNLSSSGPYVKYDKGINVKMKSFINIDDFTVLERNILYIDEDENRIYK